MRPTVTSLLLALGLGSLRANAAPAGADPVALAPRATPTVYLCGDSTMARNTNGVEDGWGQYISKYLTLSTVNRAIGGRSARSYTNEGRFAAVADAVRPGDIVVIEFGHNDGGSPTSNDNGRSDCPGAGTETCVSDKTGETVYTFVFYVVQAARLFLERGATVVLSSQTPNNQWEFGTWNGAAPRFVGYQATAARALADPRVTFVDHFAAVSKGFLRLGSGPVNAFFPNDHTHTSPAGADFVAKAFAQAIQQRMNGTTSLAEYVKQPAPVVY